MKSEKWALHHRVSTLTLFKSQLGPTVLYTFWNALSNRKQLIVL